MQAGPNIYDGRQDAYRAWELAVELAREGHPGLRAWFAGARSQEPGARKSPATPTTITSWFLVPVIWLLSAGGA